MFNAYEYDLLRRGLLLLKADSSDEKSALKTLYDRLGSCCEQRLLDVVKSRIILPKGEKHPGKFVTLFDTQRDLVTQLLPYLGHRTSDAPKNILIVLPSSSAAKVWADAMISKLPFDIARSGAFLIEFKNGPTLRFVSSAREIRGRSFDLAFILNRMSS